MQVRRGPPVLMGTLRLLSIAAVAYSCVSTAAFGAPPGSIDCAVQGLSAKQRTDVGVALVDDQRGDVAVRVHDILAKPAAVCAKANGWTAVQTESATTWSVWALMGAEVERRSGLSPADLRIMHSYVDEDPRRIDGIDRFSQAQVNDLVRALQQRGAHVHDVGKDSERELGFLLPLKEMKVEEGHFAGR